MLRENNKMSQIMEIWYFKWIEWLIQTKSSNVICFANYGWSLVLKGYNVLVVTKDNKTYAFGNNYYNPLGFRKNIFANEILKELCDQQIIDFENGLGHYYCK